VNLELEKEVVMNYFHIISHNLSGRTEADYENLNEVYFQAKIRKRNIKNTEQEY
jgi:hypothetical protein